MSGSSPFPPAFDSFDFAKHHSLDFFSFHSPSDILAPHPDLFESELDSSLAAFDELQLQLLTVDSNDAYSFLRSDTPTCGPPSTFTVSSESAYDSLSSHSDSFNYPSSNYSFPLELDMEFQRITVDPVQDYAASADPTSFGTLPPTPPHSPPVPTTTTTTKPYEPRSSFSDYTPSRITIPTSPHYFTQLGFNTDHIPHATISPSRVSAQLPVVPSIPPLRPSSDDGQKPDPRKKYKCASCPRAFARAYNLKTHMATHDPNRLKPYICPHQACRRSFSRKHDLGRHLISIHRDESIASSHHSASNKKPIGVEKGPRSWCEVCGKGWVGRESDCDCHIK
jgi:hypothetical protein